MNHENNNIFDWLKGILKAPVFKDDEEKTRVAGLLNIAAWFHIGLFAFLFVTVLSVAENLALSAGAIATLSAVIMISLFFMRQGRVQLASWIFTSTMWLCFMSMTMVSGGSHSYMASMLLPLIIVIGLIQGGRAAIGFSVLTMLVILGTSFAETRITLPLLLGLTPATPLIVMFYDLFLAAAMLYLSSNSIKKALTRARNNEQVLAERNEHLQENVEKYVDHMSKVARGNLASRLSISENGDGGEDPLIVLGVQLNETTASLQAMILQTRDAANNLNSAAAELLAATTQQLAGSNEQSAAISQTTITVEEVKAIAEQAVTRAQEVADSSLQTREVSKTGNQSVQETITSMDRIKQRVESIAENILALTEQTQQIGEIIATVSDIATQSNMLSLNASVEAVRAGEHGKGFAIVAAEVRGLATQSKQAAAQVRAILSDIQDATNAAVMATEEGAKQVEEGMQLATRTGAVIEQLWHVIDESSQTASQLVAGGRQQATGMEQITAAMTNINQATLQSLSSTRQAEATAQDLNQLARRLTEDVEQYQL